jgi:uncharacterized low-complexity protein
VRLNISICFTRWQGPQAIFRLLFLYDTSRQLVVSTQAIVTDPSSSGQSSSFHPSQQGSGTREEANHRCCQNDQQLTTTIQILQAILNSMQDEDPKDPPGFSWIESFLPAVIALSTFGGSITFSVIPSIASTDEPPYVFGVVAVRYFLSLAWLFFALALGISSAGQLVLTFHRDVVKEGFKAEKWSVWDRMYGDRPERDKKPWQRPAVCIFVRLPMSLVLQVLVLLAFLFLALVVVAYAKIVGWVAVAFTGIFMIGAFVMWYFQNKDSSNTEQVPPGQDRQDQAGQGQAGEGQAGEGQAGEGQAGQGQVGQGQVGQGQVGQDQNDHMV